MAKERKAISMEELAKHNKEEDAWMAVHGLVLNLPKDFLDEHPGGPDVVTCLAGKDATQDFEDISHSDSARDWANKFIVGYLEGNEEEDIKTKMIPKHAEVAGKGGGGGAAAFLPAVVVVIAAVVAFFVFKV
eukprot:gb/GFBE01001899.1/.p1 GENE.gb/GFBE01001899.1/~~gb/GFBE01001899.1/.p1  ORF type:complete len:132 (+),score=56.63 gb/GFBE01001899.1/:1-396(+)